MKKSQNGFVLISVLLISSISTIYAFSEIQNNQIQERIGGNQKKELNARMLSEKGVFDTFDYLKNNTTSNSVNTDLKTHVNTVLFNSNDSISIIDLDYSDGIYTFVSEGKYQGAKAALNASIKAIAEKTDDDFKDAVVGCDGVLVKGSGHIDSYNSKNGEYGASYTDKNGIAQVNKNNNASVATINADSNIMLTGSSPIGGNVSATGDVDISGSATVTGDVNANHDIVLNTQNMNNNQTLIGGNVAAGGDFDARGNTITGKATVGGTATGTGHVGNGVFAKDTNAPDEVTVGSCDPKNLASERATYASQGNSNGSFNPTSYQTEGEAFSFTKAGAEYWDPVTNTMKTSNAITMDVHGNPTEVHVYDDFTLNSRDMVIKAGEEVTILVKGDFKLDSGSMVLKGNGNAVQQSDGRFKDSDGNLVNADGVRVDQFGTLQMRDAAASVNIEAGGSLKLIVNGKVITKTGTQVKEIADPNGVFTGQLKDRTALEIFSTYESTDVISTSANDEFSDLALDIQSTNMDATTIYAPQGHVGVKTGGRFLGRVRGKTVLVNGDGGIHYDERLDKKSPFSTWKTIASYNNVSYYYAN